MQTIRIDIDKYVKFQQNISSRLEISYCYHTIQQQQQQKVVAVAFVHLED